MDKTPLIDQADMLRRAEAVLPHGVSSGNRAAWRKVITRTEGAYVWDGEGNQFIDYLLGWGPVVVGHADPRVTEAAERAARMCSVNAIGPQAGEVELAERVCEVMPSAERVAFCLSGTEATLHAVHLARAATGRRKLLKFYGAYHGWHDNLAVGTRAVAGPASGLDQPNAQGLHPAAVEDVLVTEWNDTDAVRKAFGGYGDELAAVFCEPYVHSFGCVPSAPGFLEELRQLCDRHGTVLVFDEIKTGFRAALGGYQAVCGVTPDLTAFGKAIGNGYTLAGLAGLADLMEMISPSSEGPGWGGTYNAAPYAVAAGLVTLDILADGGIEQLAQRGEELRAGLREAIDKTGVPACVAGFGSEWTVYFRSEPPRNYSEALDNDDDLAGAYHRGLLAAGILEPAYLIGDRRLCLATSDADVARTVEAAADVLARL